MSIVLHKIRKSGCNIIKIYQDFRLRKKLKNFLIWQEKINLEKDNKKQKMMQKKNIINYMKEIYLIQ